MIAAVLDSRPELDVWSREHPQATAAVTAVATRLHEQLPPLEAARQFADLLELAMTLGEPATVAALGVA
jgi:hypothetical protein